MSENTRPLFSSDVDIAKHQAYIFRDLLIHHCDINLSKSQSLDCFAQTFHDENWASLMATLRPESKDWIYYAYQKSITVIYGDKLKAALSKFGHTANHCAYRVIIDMPKQIYSSAETPESAAICTLLEAWATWTIPNLLAQYKSQGSCDDFVIYRSSSDERYIPLHFSSDPLTGNERVVGFNISTGKEDFINPSDIRFMPNALTITLPDDSAVKHPHSLPYAMAKRWIKSGGMVLITPGDDSYSEIFDDDLDASIKHVEQKNPGKPLYFFAIKLGVHHPDERWKRLFTECQIILPELENAYYKFNAGLNALIDGNNISNASMESAIKKLYCDYNHIAKLAVLSFWEDTKEINSQSSLLMAYCNASKKDREHYITPQELKHLMM